RPRRTGWFDAVAGRQVARLNGVTEVALTLLDVLDAFEMVKVCTGYRLNEVNVPALPAREDLSAQIKPEYTSVPGWQSDISGARSLDDLPEQALGYVRTLERLIGPQITMIGVGPDRNQLVALSSNAAVLNMPGTATKSSAKDRDKAAKSA